MFTTLGSGARLGLTSIGSYYRGKDHDDQVTVVSGIQRWTVPFTSDYRIEAIRPRQTAAILSCETKRALFYNAKPRSGNHGGEAWRGKTKLFWSPGTIWPPCDKGELELQGCKIP